VKVGDIIIKANGEKVDGPEKVRGPKGTKVEVTLLRDGKEITLPITRNEFSLILKDELEWVDPKTALLTINTFATGYDRNLIDKYFEQLDGKAESLIIDLHGNGGGAVINLAHLAGKVLPAKASLGTFITKYHADEYKKENPGFKDDPIAIAQEKGGWPITPSARREAKPFAGDVVVLIGPGSASASEIFAAAIEDNKRGKVIGGKSAGRDEHVDMRMEQHGARPGMENGQGADARRFGAGRQHDSVDVDGFRSAIRLGHAQ